MSQTPRNDGAITIRVKKIYVFVVLALVVGLGGGFGIAQLFDGVGGAEGPDRQPGVAQRPVVTRSPTTAPITRLSTPAPQATPQTAPEFTSGEGAPQLELVQVSIEGAPFLGPENAPVTVVEFTDYECPFCLRHFNVTVPLILRDYKDEVKYVIRNFPISDIHPFAIAAAEAAECAHKQQRFKDYHFILFQRNKALDTDSLKKYAAEIGLDTATFNQCVDSRESRDRVANDFKDGVAYGVRGTPSFFINGKKLEGARPYQTFKTMIDASLGRPTATPQPP